MTLREKLITQHNPDRLLDRQTGRQAIIYHRQGTKVFGLAMAVSQISKPNLRHTDVRSFVQFNKKWSGIYAKTTKRKKHNIAPGLQHCACLEGSSSHVQQQVSMSGVVVQICCCQTHNCIFFLSATAAATAVVTIIMTMPDRHI